MKIKGLYVIRKIAGETVVVPSGDGQLDSNVLIMLNETGEFLWNMTEQIESLLLNLFVENMM